MLAIVAFTLLGGPSESVAVVVGRFADLQDVEISQMIANTTATRWAGLDRAVSDMPWARKLLKRPDLIDGWLEASHDSPSPERFENLKSLLSYGPFLNKEAGRERQILVELVTRCSATKTGLPEGTCVRLARVAFPKSKMAHLYDGLSAQGDGTFLVFPNGKTVRKYEAKRKVAESELAKLIMTFAEKLAFE